MSESKHTPGPWRISVCPMLESSHLESSNVGRIFAEFECGCRPSHGKALRELPYNNADARLIAAAPTQHEEMLRYLPVIERAEADPELWARLTDGLGIATANGYRAAIAKAEGRNA